MTMVLEVTLAGGPVLRHRLPDRGATTIGRAPQSGLAIPEAQELSREHLLVEPVAGGFRVLVLPGAPTQARLRGVAFDDGPVLFGELLTIGALQLRFRKQAAEGAGRVLVGSLLALVTVLGASALYPSSEVPLAAAMPAPPELNLSVAACPDGHSAPLAQAEELEEQARAHAERYPFDLTDGMNAAMQFGAAARCYLLAGDQSAAARAQRVHRTWVTRLEERYHAHQLRLRVALDRRQTRVASAQLPHLVLFLRSQRDHPYTRWLIEFGARLSAE